MAEIDKVAQTGLSLINGDDVGFDGDGADDNLEQEFLGSGSSGFVTT